MRTWERSSENAILIKNLRSEDNGYYPINGTWNQVYITGINFDYVNSSDTEIQ